MSESQRFAPASARLLLALPPIMGGVVLVLLAAAVGGAVGAVLGAVGVIGAIALVVACAQVAVTVAPEELVIRNPFRTTRVPARDVAGFRPERLAGLVGPRGILAGVVLRNTHTTRVLATVGARGASAAAMHLAFRQFSAAHGIDDALERREYTSAAIRKVLLTEGAEVEVSGRMRRTDARGWGPWEPGRLSLPGVPGEGQTAVAIWLPGGGGRDLPVRIADTEQVVVRDVRFPEEAFFGDDTAFICLTTMRRTTEIALAGGEADLVHDRLYRLDGLTPAQPPSP